MSEGSVKTRKHSLAPKVKWDDVFPEENIMAQVKHNIESDVLRRHNVKPYL